MKNPYDALEEDDLENLAEWNGAPLLGRKAIGTDGSHRGPGTINNRPEPTITHRLNDNTTLSHTVSVSDSCSYCEAMK